MFDDDSRDCETPARADASPPDHRDTQCTTAPSHEDSPTWIELTAFQRDLLAAIARLEGEADTTDQRAITHALERTYPYVDHVQLQSTLAALVGRDLLVSRRVDERTSDYTPTDAGRSLLARRTDALLEACAATSHAADEPASRAGDGPSRTGEAAPRDPEGDE
ncbi:PadR family transcriptional regulator [Natrinema longum]|uniref:PadR family transcriptional regulator n=1 Tax=Natrinema longum TaxID=370324 RepID=A0A8A2UA73_9EURY|nr:PadR family transcriptional regulator [Natrinema longum]MBZ6496575.1 PadR family transcriptional regulator [Natrinema longum]QSW85524.1 PadR family transcriptional regulator [Natrinema longum]